ncbi:long-chain-fatty-acid--CoA ligase, partial [bacterium]
GAVLHTANIRLFPEQVGYVLDHAEDRAVFFDSSLGAALAPGLAASPKSAQRILVSMGGHAPAVERAQDYEELIAGEPDTFEPGVQDEWDAAILCYTSATTGDPKGVLYTHRSTVIHAYACSAGDALGLRERDAILPIVPMFHVNAWGIPFAAPMTGAKIVFPGPAMDPKSLIALLEQERVTCSAGVPTVWLGIRDELRRSGGKLAHLERFVIGGSALPAGLMHDFDAMGITAIHAWGMTESSPIGTVSRVKSALEDAPPERVDHARLTQGVFVPGMQWKLVGPEGQEQPRDGKSVGELWIRAPWVAAAYYQDEKASAAAFKDGWFRTGDICTVDELGYLQIVDRAKDLVKSGGEWISSVDLENALMGHPAVKEAAVVGVPHEKWVERPIACVVLREGTTVTEGELRGWLAERVAKWWIPDRVLFIDAIPRTGVGKFRKRDLRERFADVLVSGAASGG